MARIRSAEETARDGRQPDGGGRTRARSPFHLPVATLTAGWSARIGELLADVDALADEDRQVLVGDARRHLQACAGARLGRTLLLELHALSLTGQLTAADSRDRWNAFVHHACTEAFRDGLGARYPALLPRLDQAAGHLTQAVTALGVRLAADRPALDRLAGRRLGPLLGVTLGQGDPHRGGHTVSRLRFTGGCVMYKPRPMEVDAALDAFLAGLLPDRPQRIRTPRVLVRPGYGWAVFEHHRHCADADELTAFHRGMGHWLAVMRLLGGSDLHAANVLAVGPVPVVVDAETLFTPAPPHRPGRDAVAAARRIVGRAVVRTGILPVRNGLVAGVDYSAVGRLPDEQPALRVHGLVGAGTDEARLVRRDARPTAFLNHPGPDPRPEPHWAQITAGFDELSARMRRLDDEGALAPLLEAFLGADVRVVRRSTQVYGDIRTMLTHPAAFHDEAPALDRARKALCRHARANPGAPGDDAAIEAELAEIVAGDTPVHTRRITHEDVGETLEEWRRADLGREARFILHALPGLYRDPHHAPPPQRIPLAAHRSSADVERRRRRMAADAVAVLRDTAVHGDDGSASWIGPVLSGAGWGVRELPADLHSGQAGVALCLAAYQAEVRCGRAEPVHGLAELTAAAVRGLHVAEAARPLPRHGALTGLPGQVWAWRALAALLGDPAADRRAVALARRVDAGGDPRAGWDAGPAGAAVPLADLADATGDPGLRAVADGLARALNSPQDAPATAPGFLGGAVGTAWARRRTAGEQPSQPRPGPEWSPAGWTGEGWCRGAAGVALAACDLLVRTGDARFDGPARTAAAAVLAAGFGHGRSLCHGDCGRWEALEAARAVGIAADLPDRATLAAALLDALDRAPQGLESVTATAPGLLAGLSGTVLTLLRMHPEHAVPAVLLQEPPRT